MAEEELQTQSLNLRGLKPHLPQSPLSPCWKWPGLQLVLGTTVQGFKDQMTNPRPRPSWCSVGAHSCSLTLLGDQSCPLSASVPTCAQGCFPHLCSPRFPL